MGIRLRAWLLSGIVGLSGSLIAEEPLNVVASFSIIGDMVKAVGAEQVNVDVLVGADGDAHVYKPSPREVREVQNADLVVMNGLGFEGWMPRLLEASGYQGVALVVSDGLFDEVDEGMSDHDENHEEHEEHAPSGHAHNHSGPDPHAWHSISHAKHYIHAIADMLSQLKPEHSDAFKRRESELTGSLAELDQRMRTVLETIPVQGRVVVSAHSGFHYLADEYDIQVLSPVGVSTGGNASARDLADLVSFMKENQVRAVFAENITDNRLITQVARESGVPVFGELYSDALSSSEGPASTYIGMMTYNYELLIEALEQ